MSANVETARARIIALAAGLALACLAAAITWVSYGHFDQTLTLWERVDVWFSADIARVFDNLTDRTAGHVTTHKHPLFSLAFWPIVWVFSRFTDDSATAIGMLLALNAFTATMLLWRLLRWLGLALMDLILCLALFLSSAAFLFWFAVPETFAFGTTSILLSLQLLTLPRSGPGGLLLTEALLCMASLTITITNWGVGLIAVALRHGLLRLANWRAGMIPTLKRPVAVVGLAGGIALALASLQNAIFGQAGMFINVVALADESKFFIDVTGRSALTRLFDLSVSPIIAGDLLSYPQAAIPGLAPERGVLDMSNIAFASVAQIIATGAWLLTLALALGVFLRERGADLIVATALLSSAGFMMMHLLYGSVYFLYVAHFVAQYALISTLALRGRTKWFGRAALAAVVVFGGYHNFAILEAARALS
ncbi:hypothetical protein [Pikeienuella sp. HZG-20]|uniref:hypothetical protein n=1 Tax=Paludibacillus litoralis TaxID=3133267 RepID=UPI0030EE3F7B